MVIRQDQLYDISSTGLDILTIILNCNITPTFNVSEIFFLVKRTFYQHFPHPSTYPTESRIFDVQRFILHIKVINENEKHFLNTKSKCRG